MNSVKRWGSLIAYSIIASFIILIFIKITWVTKLFNWWTSLFDSWNYWMQYTFAFMFGLLLYQMLTKFYICGKHHSLKVFFYYPPVYVSGIFTITILSFISLFSNKIDLNIFVYPTNYLLVSFLTGFLLLSLWYHIIQNWDKTSSKIKSKRRNLPKKETYKSYKDWFEDDAPISNKSQLTPEYELYIDRTVEKLKTGSCHIALFGEFGLGKSSIINCILQELNKVDEGFIHSNIDLWGCNYKSINQFCLNRVIADLAKYVDLSSLKSLPSQYIDALKLGNNSFKLMAIFAQKINDPTDGLKKLDLILGTIDKKLVITIQDLDRCEEPVKSASELGSLLDKLKSLNNISFILALGYRDGVSDIIRKVCGYREDLFKANYRQELNEFFNICVKRARDSNKISFYKEEKFNSYEISVDFPFEQWVSSSRSLKHILRRIDSIWQDGKLMGEVDLSALFITIIIREEDPAFFEFLIVNKELMFFNEPNSPLNEQPLSIMKDVSKKFGKGLNHKTFKEFIDKVRNNILIYDNSESYSNNYFDRIMLENVPEHEIRDQEIYRLLNDVKEDPSKVDLLINKFKSSDKSQNWIYGYNKFSKDIFTADDRKTEEQIYKEMIEYYSNLDDQKELFNSNDANGKLRMDFLFQLLERIVTKADLIMLFTISLKTPKLLIRDVHTGEQGVKPIIEYFILKAQEYALVKELTILFLSAFENKNNIFKSLNFNEINNLMLVFSEIENTDKNDFNIEFHKKIILILLEKNKEITELDESNKLELYFIYYLLITYSNSIEQFGFTNKELKEVLTKMDSLGLQKMKEFLSENNYKFSNFETSSNTLEELIRSKVSNH